MLKKYGVRKLIFRFVPRFLISNMLTDARLECSRLNLLIFDEYDDQSLRNVIFLYNLEIKWHYLMKILRGNEFCNKLSKMFEAYHFGTMTMLFTQISLKKVCTLFLHITSEQRPDSQEWWNNVNYREKRLGACEVYFPIYILLYYLYECEWLYACILWWNCSSYHLYLISPINKR